MQEKLLSRDLLLDELFKKYSSGGLKRKEFEGRIFQYILDNYRRFHLYRWTREQCSDYLSWLYPRLSRAIDLYQEIGSSFDAYISAIVNWSAREYRSRQVDHQVTEYACWMAQAEEMAVHSYEPDYMKVEPVPGIASPRQILLLLLKSYYFVSDDFLVRIAPAAGVKPEELQRLIGELRDQRMHREDEIRGLQERIHCQYYRCISFEKRIRAAPEDSAIHEKLIARLGRGRVRLAAMKKRLANVRFEASNREIAEVLGIPKGTVDSALYTLKEKWRQFEKTAAFPGLSGTVGRPG